MLTRRIAKIVQAALLVVAVIWVSLGSWSAYQAGHMAIGEVTSDYKQTSANKQPEEGREDPAGALARYTFWLTVFTFILAAATIGLGVATVCLYMLARLEFISSHRPLMKVKLVELVEIENEWAGVAFTVVNVGSTDAHVTGSCAKADLFGESDWPHPNDYGVDNVIPPRRFAPGATETYRIATNEPIGYLQLAADRSFDHPLALRFYGYIVYNDKTGITRTTYFCRAYNDRFDRFDSVDRPDYDAAD